MVLHLSSPLSSCRYYPARLPEPGPTTSRMPHADRVPRAPSRTPAAINPRHPGEPTRTILRVPRSLNLRHQGCPTLIVSPGTHHTTHFGCYDPSLLHPTRFSNEGLKASGYSRDLKGLPPVVVLDKKGLQTLKSQC